MDNRRRAGRNGKIELMRFICAIIIVLYHFDDAMDKRRFFASGSLAVEFFFILSGYLMMAYIDRQNNTQAGYNLGKETFQFLGRKVKALYPEVLIAYIIGFVVRCMAENKSFSGGVWLAVDSIWEVALLRQTGLALKGINPVTWYISTMLMSMAIYYPLLRKYKEMMSHILIPLASLLVLGWLCQNYTSPLDPSKWLGWAFKGAVRGFGEIGMGVVCYQLTKAFSKLHLTMVGKATVTFLEPVAYGLYIAYMYSMSGSKQSWIVIPLLVLGIGISFSGQTLTHRLLDGSFTTLLGKISFPLYLGHFYWATFFLKLLPEGMSWENKLGIYIALSVATTIVLYVISALTRRYHIGRKIGRLFVREAD